MRIHMPLSAECKRILSYSAEEANDMDHPYIGPEHLLLAVLRENTCVAARLLAEMGVQLERVRQQLILETPRSAEGTPVPDTTAKVARDTVHALIDRLPEPMLAYIKEVIDRILARSSRERIRDDDTTVVKGAFSNRIKSAEQPPEPGRVTKLEGR
jgi:ATP-dependent Clp protease ATP-binding subunit ClpA